jgi:PilZ domain-containing protein
MGLDQWLTQFCKLHDQARNGTLHNSERNRYNDARDELARALLKAQRIALQPAEIPRQTLRAALALSISLHLPGGVVQILTRDISSGGFSVKLANLPPNGTVVPFTLRLSGKDTLEGRAKLISATPAAEGRRASFSFEKLAPDLVERIEMTVFDAVVAQLKA